MLAPRSCASALAVCLLATSAVVAQDFRVFTRINDLTDPSRDREPISHSTTLFHAGRVYDFVGPAGELVVLDFGNRSITLLDTARRVSTTIDFDQVNHLLKRSRKETLDQADQLAGSRKLRAAEELRFMIEPRFETMHDPKRNVLDLRSPSLAYSVQCAKPDREEQIEAYLRYADWATRLNHVLNPDRPFPAAREALNAALRERGLLPVEVTLTVRGENGVQRLQAVHRAHWQLDTTDRRHIHHWRTLLSEDAATRRVDLMEYQRTVLTAKSR